MANDNRDEYTGEEYDEDVAPDMKEAEEELDGKERMTDGGAGNVNFPKVDRRTVLKAGAGVGIASLIGFGLSNQDSEPTENPEPGNRDPGAVNKTDRSDEIGDNNEEPTEEEPVEDEEPDFRENIPVDGLDLYVDRLEQAEATIDTDEIVEILDGAGETARAQGTALLQEFADASNTRNHKLPQELYNLAKSYHTQIDDIKEQTDVEVADLIFNTNIMYGADTDNTAEVYPVQNNGDVGLPTIHTHNGTITFGQDSANDPEYLSRLKNSSDGGAIFPQDMEAVRESIDDAEEWGGSQEQINELRREYNNSYSSMLFGVGEEEDLRPRTYEDGQPVWESRMGERDFQLFKQFQMQYSESEHAGNGQVTDFTYEDGEFHFRSGEMEMSDPLQQ